MSNAPTHAPVIEVSGLEKSYGATTVLRGLSFRVEPGECLGILGPNGAGKTTTIKILLGLLEPSAGTVRLLGFKLPSQARQARQRTGVVPQFDNLDPDFNCAENLLVFGRYFGLSSSHVRREIPRLLDFSGLKDREQAKLHTLSGGMKRRLSLARALVNDPELIVLDEPTTGLDPQARHVIWERLRQLRSAGKTLLLTTHFMEEAERLCSRLLIMDQGKLIAHGSPRELITRHIEPQVVEVHGAGLSNWLAQGIHLPARLERVGDTVFCYGTDASPILASLQGISELSYLHRAANLEDVFLLLTGRDLRD